MPCGCYTPSVDVAAYPLVSHSYAMPCSAVPCRSMTRRAMPSLCFPCHAMPRHATPCHAMPCPSHAFPCHAMPSHLICLHVSLCLYTSMNWCSCSEHVNDDDKRRCDSGYSYGFSHSCMYECAQSYIKGVSDHTKHKLIMIHNRSI
jgi:hypothetical protein